MYGQRKQNWRNKMDKNMRMKQDELQEVKDEFKRKIAKEDDKIPKFEHLNQILLKKLRNSEKEI